MRFKPSDMPFDKLLASIEAILFAADEPVAPAGLARALEIEPDDARKLILLLSDTYEAECRGIRVREINGSYTLCSSADHADAIRAFVSMPKKRGLTPALMETLAIIAYKQPVTKAQIEEIRGVNADHAVNKLMEYGFVLEKGRLNAPYKPILLGTSDEFLKAFGLTNLGSMPSFEVFEEAGDRSE